LTFWRTLWPCHCSGVVIWTEQIPTTICLAGCGAPEITSVAAYRSPSCTPRLSQIHFVQRAVAPQTVIPGLCREEGLAHAGGDIVSDRNRLRQFMTMQQPGHRKSAGPHGGSIPGRAHACADTFGPSRRCWRRRRRNARRLLGPSGAGHLAARFSLRARAPPGGGNASAGGRVSRGFGGRRWGHGKRTNGRIGCFVKDHPPGVGRRHRQDCCDKAARSPGGARCCATWQASETGAGEQCQPGRRPQTVVALLSKTATKHQVGYYARQVSSEFFQGRWISDDMQHARAA